MLESNKRSQPSMVVINTKRLILKPLGIEYLKTVHAYASDMENTKYMVRLPNETIEETMDFLTCAEKEWASGQPSFYEFAVIYKDQQIGAVSIYLKEDMSGELGWIIHKKYWGQGIAYEAAEALLDYAKKEWKIRHFAAHCDADNTASYRIMEKLGMTRTGTYGGRLSGQLHTHRIVIKIKTKVIAIPFISLYDDRYENITCEYERSMQLWIIGQEEIRGWHIFQMHPLWRNSQKPNVPYAGTMNVCRLIQSRE